MSVVQVRNFSGAALNIASTTLRAVIGDIPWTTSWPSARRSTTLLRAKLDEVTERWGVKVTNVEIREIIPPAAVQDAMTRQMSAERTRRAVVTEAEGAKQAAITVAEGSKRPRSSTPRAQAGGDPQRRGRAAVRDPARRGLRARAQRIFETAQGVDQKTMTLQYFDALKQIASSPSTKVVVPTELAGLAAGVAAFVNSDGDTRARPAGQAPGGWGSEERREPGRRSRCTGAGSRLRTDSRVPWRADHWRTPSSSDWPGMATSAHTRSWSGGTGTSRSAPPGSSRAPPPKRRTPHRRRS
jgi:hypothetical protein